MTIETVDITTLSEDPANARTHSPDQIGMLAASLRRFGQQKPIVVSTDGVVVAGNGTLRAARSLGWTTIAIVRSALVGADRVAFGIADNRLADLSEFDPDTLINLVGSLADEEGFDGAALGYTPTELTALLGGGEPEESPGPTEFPSYDTNISTDHQCPKCGFRWSGSTSPTGGGA